MNLSDYAAPSNRTRITRVLVDGSDGMGTGSHPADADRIWILVHNPGDVPVDVTMGGPEDPATLTLGPQERTELSRPVYLGPLFFRGVPGARVHITELLKHA